jgi:hypothetical protein
MIIPGHLEETFHKEYIEENHPPSLLSNEFTVCNIKLI